MIGFRPSTKDRERLARLREALQQREPHRKITLSDVLRFAVCAASGGMISPEASGTIPDPHARRPAA